MIRIIEDTQSVDELYSGEPIEDVIKEEKETFNNNLKKLRKAQGLIKEAYQLAIQYEDRLDNVKDEKTLKELFSVNNKIHSLITEADL